MSKRARLPGPPGPPPAPPALVEDPQIQMQALLGQSVDAIRKKVAGGKPLTKAERQQVEEVLFESVPSRVDPPREPEEGEPADVRCASQRALAAACGVHVNTITNWKNRGVAPLGEAPFSLKAYYLLLRRKALLGDCKPTAKAAHELWRWSFGAGAGESLDPDDPIHNPPMGWDDEKNRQGALGLLAQRRKLQVEVETLEGERLPGDLVRHKLHDLADEVKGVLRGFLSVAGNMKGLTPNQRAELSEMIQDQIAKAQAELAKIRVRA